MLPTRLYRTAAWAFASLAVAFIATLSSTARAAEPYYSGKTLTLIVGFAAGGPVDLLARLLAPYVSDHTAGKPNIIVKNMPAAGSIQGHNYVFEIASAKGDEVFFGPWFPVHQILGAEGVRFKYQDFTHLAAFRAAGLMMYGRADAAPGGVKKGADLLKASNLKFGASHPYNTFDLHGRLALEALGVDYRHVTGYRGSATIRPAVMRNEVNIAVDSIASYHAVVVPTIVKPGIGIPLWSYPVRNDAGNFVRDPDLTDVPSFVEVYKDAHGKDPSGKKWDLLEFVMLLNGSANTLVLGPPKMNRTAAGELRKGVYHALADAKFQNESEKRFGYRPLSAPPTKIADMMKLIATVDAKTVAALKEHVESTPGTK